MTYEQQLQQEAAVWGAEAERMAATMPPDWRYYATLRHNVLLHKPHIENLLQAVQPRMRVLEAGCASGWLTLALAQRGAHAIGLDISAQSLAIARRYYEQVQATVSGTVEYHEADLNQLQLSENTYDIIAIQGTLHHLVNLESVVEQLWRGLKVGGLLWVNDEARQVASRAALLSAAFMFLLPTHTPYSDKVRGLLKFGVNAPARIRASMEAEGLSPFEGAGRENDWLKLVQERFTIERLHQHPAITGYLAHQVRLADRFALPLLRGIRALDTALVRWGGLPNSGVVVYARK